jgi:DNA/RNA endonuclease G (NUC1)
MQAFLLPNRDGLKADWEVYSVSVDLLEWLTGIDFYEAMADDVEAKLESENDCDSWCSVAAKRVEKQQNTEQRI